MIPSLKPTTHARYRWVITFADPSRTDRAGRPRRSYHYFTNEEEAQKKHREMLATVAATGVVGLHLSPAFRRDALDARAALDAAGFSSASLVDVAQAWLRTQGAGPASRQLVAPLLDEFLEFKSKAEGATQRTRENLENRILAWLDREKILTVGQITREAALALRDREGVDAATRKNDMNAASSFLTWLVNDKRMLPLNPLLGQRRPRVQRKRPKVYTAAQARAILDAASTYKGGRHARAVGLLFFAGLRPSELPAALISLDAKRPIVRVEDGKMRGRANRIVDLTKHAARWLARHPAPILMPTTGQRRQIVKAARAKWIQDGARHTWISSKCELMHDDALVARMAGTSKDIIFAHYHALMPRGEAKRIDQLGDAAKKGSRVNRQ